MENNENYEKNLEDFEKKINYTFKDKNLLFVALSHSSFANEKRKLRHSNERLEFLGDSVLSIVVSQYLFEHFTHLPEGELTKIRASLVCEKSLYEFAKEIDLGEYLFLGKGEENTGGRERTSILADAFEAVIAAVFLDGGLEAAKKHILRFIPKDIDSRKSVSFSDHKTILQEIIQKNPEEKVEYKLVGQSGPDHNKAFKVQVCLNSNVIGTGIGKSKKEAEQMAAKEALELMGYEPQ
ncbi:MAG: ribonuclease III [Oscillospiraceae bacterium]